MEDTDALLAGALRRYVTMAVKAHAEVQQLDRAYVRGDLTFRVEYDSQTQIVRVCGINKGGQALVISERKLGS